MLERAYFDAEDHPVIGPEGYARTTIRYSNGKHAETWEYDVEGNPTGTHRISEYGDVKGKQRLLSDSWYNAEGRLTPGPNGYAKV